MSLKLATLDDLPKFLELCRSFYEESPFSPQVLYSEERVSLLLNQAVSGGYSQVLPLLLLDECEDTIGLLVGCATTTPFSDDLIASELAWYVEPSHRGSGKAMEMVYAYEAWARKVGCKHVSMSLLTTLTDVSKIYERLGYKKTEISFIKEL